MRLFHPLLTSSCALLLFSSYPSLIQAQPSRGWLTVDTIMRDPAWMGTSPKQVYWSDDSRWVYFTWRQNDDKGDSLYKVPTFGGTPRRVTLEERRSMPSPGGDWDSEWRRKVYEKNGDVFL